jgi:hypothetical protein
MEEKLARGISYILHPLLIPTYVYLLMMNQEAFYAFLLPAKAKYLIIALVFTTTFLLPFLLCIVMLKRGIIRSFMMETKEERLFPFLITAILFYLCAYLIKSFQLPSLFYVFSLGSTLVVIIALLVNFSYKISIHMVGIGGALGTFLGLALKWEINFAGTIILLILLSGLVGFSRFRLSAHKQLEIYSGFLTGFGIMFGLYMLL